LRSLLKGLESNSYAPNRNLSAFSEAFRQHRAPLHRPSAGSLEPDLRRPCKLPARSNLHEYTQPAHQRQLRFCPFGFQSHIKSGYFRTIPPNGRKFRATLNRPLPVLTAGLLFRVTILNSTDVIHLKSKSILSFLLAAICVPAIAQEPASQPSPNAGTNPLQLVRLTVENELKPPQKGLYFTYRDVKKKGNNPVEVKQMVETGQDLVLGRLISLGGKPLTPEQQQKEEQRLHRLLTDPGAVKEKQKSQQEDDQRVRRMVQALSDAFLYTYAATESGKNGQIVVLNFKPNPNFDPPSRELQVYTGMAGTMRIAVPQDRIASLEATLVEDVNFGWGILGRLYKGGRFAIEQTEVGDGQWDLTSMSLNFAGRALLFKHIDIQQHETTSDYRRVPAMNIAQALELLKKTADDDMASTRAQQGGGNK